MQYVVILDPSDNFLEVIKKSNETPVKKFQFPQTSAQEIGWNTEPLVSNLYIFSSLFVVELHIRQLTILIINFVSCTLYT